MLKFKFHFPIAALFQRIKACLQQLGCARIHPALAFGSVGRCDLSGAALRALAPGSPCRCIPWQRAVGATTR